MATYRPTRIRDLRPGDQVLTKFHDADGAYTEIDVPVVAVRVRPTRTRVTFGGGWGTEVYPSDREVGVRMPDLFLCFNGQPGCPNTVLAPGESCDVHAPTAQPRHSGWVG